MSARKPFTKRERSAMSQHRLGHRPVNCWGDGDLPAPWAAGDVVELVGTADPDRIRGQVGPYFVVDTVFSVDEGDAWYFRVDDGTQEFGSDRMHVAFAARSTWDVDVDFMAPFRLVESADPEGLALRERMLAAGWSFTARPTCPTCGAYRPDVSS